MLSSATVCYSPLFHIRYYFVFVYKDSLKKPFLGKRENFTLSFIQKIFDNLFVACCFRRQVVFAHEGCNMCEQNFKFNNFCNPLYFFINNTIFIIVSSFKICRFWQNLFIVMEYHDMLYNFFLHCNKFYNVQIFIHRNTIYDGSRFLFVFE